jgi:hypothetical protein
VGEGAASRDNLGTLLDEISKIQKKLGAAKSVDFKGVLFHLFDNKRFSAALSIAIPRFES